VHEAEPKVSRTKSITIYAPTFIILLLLSLSKYKPFKFMQEAQMEALLEVTF